MEMAFCSNCGKQLDEGARFCSTCGASVAQPAKEDNSGRKTVYDGELHKCPNCGEQINSFVAVCPACGYEFRGTKTASCVKELAAKLEQVRVPEQRDDLIRNFYIPNTKEDICEFFILAVSNIKARDDCEDAWRAKLEQAYQKARLSFGNDSSFSEISELYEGITKREQLNQFMKKKYAFPIASLILGFALIVISAVFRRLRDLEYVGYLSLLIIAPASAIVIYIKDIPNRFRNRKRHRKW